VMFSDALCALPAATSRPKASDAESHKRSGGVSVQEGIAAQLSEKIALAMTIWVLFALILSINAGIEVFLTLILIGVLVIRELTDSFTPVRIKERIDFFIYAFLIVFAVIVVRRVWEILG